MYVRTIHEGNSYSEISLLAEQNIGFPHSVELE